MMRHEYDTSQNIKSKSTKTAVKSALRSIQHKLSLYKQVPETGLVIFAGETPYCV